MSKVYRLCGECGEWQLMIQNIEEIFTKEHCQKCDGYNWRWTDSISERTFDYTKSKNKSRKIKKNKV